MMNRQINILPDNFEALTPKGTVIIPSHVSHIQFNQEQALAMYVQLSTIEF